MEEGYVHSYREKKISTIEFFHPLSNSMPGHLLNELSEKIRTEDDADTTVIVLRSGGDKSFCAGASFNELTAIQTRDEGIKFFSGFAEVINTMRKSKKLIVARIQGKCVGGGVGIAAAADYVIATETAGIKLSELALGIGPFVIGPAVERKIGSAAFSELAIDAATWRTADWAKQKGLFNEVHESIAAMDVSVHKLSTALSAYNPEAMTALKKIFWKETDHWDKLLTERAALSGKLVMSLFTKNAIEKFRSR